MRAVFALMCLALAAPAFAEWNNPHVAGAREHRLIKLYPQARVDEYDEKDFDSVELLTGIGVDATGEQEAKSEEIEGRAVRYAYEHKPGTSAFEILRQYENALAKAGFVKIVAGRTDKIPPHHVVSGETFGAFRLDRDGRPVAYVNVSAGANGTWMESRLTIVEPGTLQQKLSADADSFYDALAEKGRVAVYGINFDTGKASIRPESVPVLEQIQRLLVEHPELKLRVEGHTDNVGQPAANLKLSQARAGAVVSWLTKRGVKPDGLTAAGHGDTKPVSDNGTDAGREKNRRVELAR